VDSRGLVFPGEQPKEKARLLAQYEQLAREGMGDLSAIGEDDLRALLRLHDRRLGYYREERRMHFGAFALAGLAFLVLLPALIAANDMFVPLAVAEALLFALLVPYTFVYRRYEENLRRMMGDAMLLENAIRLKEEARRG
jgi:hypothetical protein